MPHGWQSRTTDEERKGASWVGTMEDSNRPVLFLCHFTYTSSASIRGPALPSVVILSSRAFSIYVALFTREDETPYSPDATLDSCLREGDTPRKNIISTNPKKRS